MLIPMNLPPTITEAYTKGVSDSKYLSVPKLPTAPTLSPEITYNISQNGDDSTGNGSVAQPFKTWNKTRGLVQQYWSVDPDALVAVAFMSGQTFSEPIGLAHARSVLFTTYGGVQPAIMSTPDSTFQFVGGAGIGKYFITNLSIINPPVPPVPYGIYVDGAVSVTVYNCEMIGMRYGGSFENITGPAIWNSNFIAQTWNPTGDYKAQGIYVENCPGFTSNGNIYYHCGWNDALFDPTNAKMKTGLALSHAEYLNSGSIGGHVLSNNYYINSAAQGPMMRSGGNIAYCVCQSNGTACDIMLGGNNSICTDCVVFGPTNSVPPYWGGGIWIQAITAKVDRVLALSNSSSEQAPFITVGWDTTQIGPMPPNTNCSIDNVRGVWPKATYATNNGRQSVNGSFNIRKPLPSDVYPALWQFLSAVTGTNINSDDMAAQCLKNNRLNNDYSAANCVSWSNRSW